MLNRLIPQNSALRQRLRLMSRHANFAVKRRLKRNFTAPTQSGMEELRELLERRYLPSWYSEVDMQQYLASSEGRQAVRTHLFHRLEMDRYELIPWLDSILPLQGARILEIGCGTGSATVALAEQGARVTALDLHAEALLVAERRCQIHGLSEVRFVNGNAQDLTTLFAVGQFDLIFFFAVLEHMTLAERDAALRAAWSLLDDGRYLCLGETPNRLWPYDAHTSQLPFFNWLPDEIAFRYSQRSPRLSLRTRFREINEESMLSFRREGRGMSFHELDLALQDQYRVVGDQIAFLSLWNPVKLLKRFIARDAVIERALHANAPRRHRGFFRQNLDLVIQKPSQNQPTPE